jgi:hypothetical protein
MSVARFTVYGTLDGAGGARPGTVEIDREAGIFRVRPYRSHTTYELPLSDVATWVCRQHQFAIVREEKRAKKANR